MKIKIPSHGLLFFVICIFLKLTPTNAQTLTLTPSDYNGYNISCFGFADGAIDLSITGGTPPYSIRWSTDDDSEDIDSIPAGYYRVEVDDADSTTGPVSAEITLNEPRKIEAEVSIHTYNAIYNISVFGACNGMISFIAEGGVTPYSYSWAFDSNTSNNRTNLCAGEYKFRVTDANQCIFGSESMTLRQPERSDWQMSGNSNIDPNTQYIGTSDSIDFVFRTNGIERLRLGANGNINISDGLNVGNTLNFSNNRVVDYRAATATEPEIMSFGSRANPAIYAIPCISPQPPFSFDFPGLLHSWGTVAGGSINLMEFGFDGSNSIIEAVGSNSGPIDHRLLLNYNCGKDVFVGNPNIGGNLTANNDFNVAGESHLTGNVLIGTTTNFYPAKKLVVDGNVRFLNDIGPDQFEIIASDTEKPYKRGISIGTVNNNNNGFFNLWINGNMGLSRFNFKDSYNDATLMTLTENKLLGLGTTDPTGFQNSLINPGQGPLVHIKGNSPSIRLENSGTTTGDLVISNQDGYGNIITDKGINIFIDPYAASTNNDNYFAIIRNHSSITGSIIQSDILFKVNHNGYVGARGVRVTTATFPDYVFADNYKLTTLTELELYIKTNKKLPNIPSAEEVIANGLDIGDIVVKQMEKIEELTLYIIELGKQNDELRNRIEKLEKNNIKN